MVTVGCDAPPSASPSPPAPADEAVHLVFLHVNDVHGQTQAWRDFWGQSFGGYARLSTAVIEQRNATADRVFLIHAGDEFSRGDELTKKTHGAANVAIMNRIGFDAWTPGNGEFYGGLDNLAARIAETQFPVLAANVTRKDSGACIARPFVIENAGSVRVAFLGLCTVRTEHRSAKPLTVADAVATARRLVPELRKQADVVVAVTHMGLDNDADLARKVPGIDLIIGGHSHSALPWGLTVQKDGRKTLIVQAGEHLRYLGQVDMTLQHDGGKWRIAGEKARLITLDDSFRRDPAITAMIAEISSGHQQSPQTQPAQ